jgi:hypothetical protein
MVRKSRTHGSRSNEIRIYFSDIPSAEVGLVGLTKGFCSGKKRGTVLRARVTRHSCSSSCSVSRHLSLRGFPPGSSGSVFSPFFPVLSVRYEVPLRTYFSGEDEFHGGA